MASEKQIAANRRNAQLSPGPSSPEAKAKTRLNAMRDGITGQVITLSEEELPIFERLKAELIEDLAPKTTMELHLVSSIAWDTWRLDHLRAVEMNLYALGTQDPDCDVDCNEPKLQTAMSEALTFVKQSKQMGLMSIYEQRLNRSIHKNRDKLAAHQTERKRNYEHGLKEEMDIAKANETNGLPYQAPSRHSRNGIIFSTSEILAAANRQSVVSVAQSHSLFNPATPEAGPNAMRPIRRASGTGKTTLVPEATPTRPRQLHTAQAGALRSDRNSRYRRFSTFISIRINKTKNQLRFIRAYCRRMRVTSSHATANSAREPFATGNLMRRFRPKLDFCQTKPPNSNKTLTLHPGESHRKATKTRPYSPGATATPPLTSWPVTASSYEPRPSGSDTQPFSFSTHSVVQSHSLFNPAPPEARLKAESLA